YDRVRRSQQPTSRQMIEIGGFRTGYGGKITRRSLLRASFATPFTGLLQSPTLAGENRAKSVILLWLWGGPSHLDTFDPKPRAPVEIRGPFSPIATQTPGLQFTELLPLLASRSQRFSVVRTNTNLTNVHRVAGSIALTGSEGRNGDNDYAPNFGSVLQRVHPAAGELPPFVAVTPGKLRTAIGPLKGYGGGRWGNSYDPFPVQCNDRSEVYLPTLKLLEGLSLARLDDRRRLLRELDQLTRSGEQSRPEQWTAQHQKAFRLLASAAGRRAFDLSAEPARVRASYGRSQFGQSCLLARRLVETGVPYIQVNWSKWVENIYDGRTDFGWDTHWLNFEHLADRHAPILDRALSALLDDLSERGLLADTLVLAMGEFGRTPKISDNGGRDHWARCYSSLWAGGGIQPGRVVGSSDARGYDPVTGGIGPDRVGATLLERAGITSAQRAALNVLPNAQAIEGLV
ncbi:MAG: DUF1501 domain-containing protein, partial [Pirellulales bacterium]|nr:DUF1501 domain-containing protein [Pirellulales bacterium]